MEWNLQSDLPHHLREVIRCSLLNNTAELNEISERMSMSKRTMQRRLKKIDTRFRWQLDSVRAGEARKLLMNTEYSVARISSSLGYTDQATFSRSFHRWYQTSPSYWRKISKASIQRAG